MADEVQPFNIVSSSITYYSQGASSKELLIEASRRNNTSLLNDLLSSVSKSSSDPSSAIAALVNDTVSPTGLYPLHIAASNGSYDVLDILLDQEGVETEPLTKRDRRTPLHSAVEFCNGLDKEEWEEGGAGRSVVEILLDAGCDPRLKDKSGMRAVDVCDPRNESVRGVLRRGEMALLEGEALVVEDEGEEGGSGPPSDSD